MSTPHPETHLDNTLAALEPGVTTIPLSEGRDNIQDWLDILADEPSTPALQAVMQSLRELHNLISGSTTIEVSVLQTLLKRLGEEVQVVANGLPDGDETEEKPRKRKKLSAMSWYLLHQA